jgi:hypothetical protein
MSAFHPLRTLERYEINRKMTRLTWLSHGQRASLATLLTLVGVVAMEVAHFSSGTSPALEVSRFAIPALLSFGLFKTLKQRITAFILLTLIGLAGTGAAVIIYLTPR